MTEALRLAENLEAYTDVDFDGHLSGAASQLRKLHEENANLSDQFNEMAGAYKEAAAELRRQQAEIERLNQALTWEQNRSGRIGTHGPGCHTWGSSHYECLLRKYKELEGQK